jgi:hypothetical protein
MTLSYTALKRELIEFFKNCFSYTDEVVYMAQNNESIEKSVQCPPIDISR